MKKFIFLILIALVLSGCAGVPAVGTVPPEAGESVPVETLPEDGNVADVTCKGSYTGESHENVTVAYAGDRVLSREELQVWYWTAVADHRVSDAAVHPDYDRPLDAQSCPLDSSVNSWQQYFLKQALSNWHTVAMLNLESETVPMETEAAYQPNWKAHERYMTGMPAAKYLYGHNVYYQVNTLHQAYLEELPQLLRDLATGKGYADVAALTTGMFGTDSRYLQEFARDYNRAYMYFTALSYYIEPTQEELDAYFADNYDTDSVEVAVNIRHLLLVPQDIIQEPVKTWSSKKSTEPTEPIVLEAVEIAPDGTVTCSKTAWSICEEKAKSMIAPWAQGKATEADFAQLANQESFDTGSAHDGGAYRGIRKGQLMEPLEDWCFDPSRQPGDTTMIRTQYGIHLLYFSGSESLTREQSKVDYLVEQQRALLENIRAEHTLYVDYEAITLGQGSSLMAPEELLYPDIGHERFPEIPLYLQQDYPNTMYGSFPIRTHGCGITTMAMLASYMADDELTPPEMCARYGNYCYVTGTDGSLFSETPQQMGFYCRKRSYNVMEVMAALQEGQIVISCQHRGYWTRGGHYIALERVTENRRIQVRDSNIYNYGKLTDHRIDLHTWGSITTNGSGYWIFEDKVVTTPACCRCGDPEGFVDSLLLSDYTCQKCETALIRRTTYLTWDGGTVQARKSVLPEQHAFLCIFFIRSDSRRAPSGCYTHRPCGCARNRGWHKHRGR